MSADLSEADPARREHSPPLGLDIQQEAGKFIIKSIQANGAAAQAGFQVGDQVLAVNGLAVLESNDIHKIMDIWQGAEKEERIRFSINRSGKLAEFFVAVPGTKAKKRQR